LKKSPFISAVFLVLTSLAGLASAQSLLPGYLRTECKVSPVTDVAAPRLSWELTSSAQNQLQSAYQIPVASSPEKLSAQCADLWDSGKVGSRATG